MAKTSTRTLTNEAPAETASHPSLGSPLPAPAALDDRQLDGVSGGFTVTLENALISNFAVPRRRTDQR